MKIIIIGGCPLKALELTITAGDEQMDTLAIGY